MEKKKYNRFGYSRDLKTIGIQILSFLLCILMVGLGLALYNFKLLSWIYFAVVYMLLPVLFFKFPQKMEKISGFTYFLLITVTFASFQFPDFARTSFGVYGTWIALSIYGYLVKRKHNKLLKEYYEKK